MSKQDYIPKSDTEFLAWHDNFTAQVGPLGPIVGLEVGETNAFVTANNVMHQKLNAANSAKAIAQARNSEKSVAFTDGVAQVRSLARRIKAHPAYTSAMGEQLGIVGPEDSTDLSQSKPTLKSTAVTPGSVTIGFNKSVSTGVRILSRRGTETAFTFLAIDTASPYIDNRPNLVAGTPESRQYQAQYLSGDDLVGQLSDILSITVPG